MKNIRILLLIFTLVFFVKVNAQTNWSLIKHTGINLIITSPTTAYTYSNKSIGSHGSEYVLKKSTDAFQTFNIIKTKIGQYGCYMIDEFFFIDSDTGYISELCTGSISVYKTYDGGHTWAAAGVGGQDGISLFF